MSQKCVHKGCGKIFTDADEPCVYHPGPPEFHEGQKGWKCCKPRVLTFDEFLEIPPCTTGKHSTVDDTPVPPPKPQLSDTYTPTTKPISTSTSSINGAASPPAPKPISVATPRSSSPAPAPVEDESDNPDATIPAKATCKRRACGASYDPDTTREEEECVHHPGVPIFHEGSKGWTCCKRRVLEFDEFMKIEGCKKRKRHCFVGKKKDPTTETRRADKEAKGDGQEEKVDSVRHDFYQTSTAVIVSFYLKKIDKARAKVEFVDQSTVALDLPTTDGRRWTVDVPLFGRIDTGKSSFRVLGTKLEVTFVKEEAGTSWGTVRSDERGTGEIIQTGQAGRF